MGNIINDIVEDVNIKPNKTKIVFRWILIGAATLITLAFAFGQFKSSFFNRMDSFETTLKIQTTALEQLKGEVKTGLDDVDIKFDKIYGDGFEAFEEYQNFNKEQLLLVLDYGQINKDLLKRMLELNAKEKTKKIETQLEQAKTDKPEGQIIVRPIKFKTQEYLKLEPVVSINTNDTIFYLSGATKEYINNIDKTKYNVGTISKNFKYYDLYDVTYRNK